jgi:hypothetical protein
MQRICPKCGSTSVVTFDADEDWCTQCKSRFPGVTIPCHCGEIDRLTAGLSQLRTAHDAAVEKYENRTPTEWAYNQVCEARNKWQERAEKAEAERDTALATGREAGLREAAGICRERATKMGSLQCGYAADDILAAIPSPPKGCEWTRPEGWSGMHDTGCGHLLDYEEAFGFCPYCGKAISIKAEEGKP